jgi:hypothetical protein
LNTLIIVDISRKTIVFRKLAFTLLFITLWFWTNYLLPLSLRCLFYKKKIIIQECGVSSLLQ